MLMLAFFATTSALAQGLKLTVEKCFLAPGETTSVIVSLTNDERVSLVTGYVQLPEGLTFVTEEGKPSYILSAKLVDAQLTSHLISISEEQLMTIRELTST